MCTTSWTSQDTSDVTIGRELFTSIAYMNTLDASATCRIRPSNSQYKYKILRLAFGMQDANIQPYQSAKPAIINVYLDGNLKESRLLKPGKGSLIILNVSRTSTVTLEVPKDEECGYFGTVYFTQAILEPISR